MPCSCRGTVTLKHFPARSGVWPSLALWQHPEHVHHRQHGSCAWQAGSVVSTPHRRAELRLADTSGKCTLQKLGCLPASKSTLEPTWAVCRLVLPTTRCCMRVQQGRTQPMAGLEQSRYVTPSAAPRSGPSVTDYVLALTRWNCRISLPSLGQLRLAHQRTWEGPHPLQRLPPVHPGSRRSWPASW